VDRSRRRVEEAGLRWAGRRGLPLAQLEHPQQTGILRPQPGQLRSYHRGNLSHAHTICTVNVQMTVIRRLWAQALVRPATPSIPDRVTGVDLALCWAQSTADAGATSNNVNPLM